MTNTIKTALYDIEADGLNPTKVHCLVIREAENDNEHVFVGWDEVDAGVRLLEQADVSVAHFGLGYDIPVLERLHGFNPKTGHVRRDSLVMSQMLIGDIKESFDFDEWRAAKRRIEKGNAKQFEFKSKYIGSHGLDAWGYRVGLAKGDYAAIMEAKGLDPWAECNPEMVEYCRGDVEVLKKLWNDRIEPLMKQGNEAANKRAVAIEHFMAKTMHELERNGIKFDTLAGRKLAAELEARRKELEAEIVAEFGERIEPAKWMHRPNPNNEPAVLTNNQYTYTGNLMWHPRHDWQLKAFNQHREMWGAWKGPRKAPRRKNSKKPPPIPPYRVRVADSDLVVEEGSYTPILRKKVQVDSRKQVARRLLELGWEPDELTPTGDPVLSETALNKAAETIPIAKKVATYYLITKRLGQLQNGKQAWLKLVDDDGFIHPTIRPCATVTARATHANPNISQVPAIKFLKKGDKTVAGWGEEGEWGSDCRALFIVPEGFKQVGSDLSGLELRAFAEELYDYDEGAFFNVLMNEDFHEKNRQILDIPNRTDAKRFIFAWMYGAGDEKLGSIIYPERTVTAKKNAGKTLRSRITSGITGVANLLNDIRRSIRRRSNADKKANNPLGSHKRGVGLITALDGRLIAVRGMHAALNTLLQSAGAIVSKYWIYCILQELKKRGYKSGYENDYVFMVWSHDEVQFAVREHLAEEFAQIFIDAASAAGKMLKMRIPIEAESKIGMNWQECH